MAPLAHVQLARVRVSPSTDHSDKPILSSSTFQHRINRFHIHILLDMVGPAIQLSPQLCRDEFRDRECHRWESFPATCAVQPTPAEARLIK